MLILAHISQNVPVKLRLHINSGDQRRAVRIKFGDLLQKKNRLYIVLCTPFVSRRLTGC